MQEVMNALSYIHAAGSDCGLTNYNFARKHIKVFEAL